jgi:hypothetical protein
MPATVPATGLLSKNRDEEARVLPNTRRLGDYALRRRLSYPERVTFAIVLLGFHCSDGDRTRVGHGTGLGFVLVSQGPRFLYHLCAELKLSRSLAALALNIRRPFLRASKERRVLTGKQFRLTKPTVALQLQTGTRTMVTLPSDAVINVRSGPPADGNVTEKGIVCGSWEGRTIALFAVDLERRGVEVLTSGHQSSSANTA